MDYNINYHNLGYRANLTCQVKHTAGKADANYAELAKHFITPDNPKFTSILYRMMQSRHVLEPEIFGEDCLLRPKVRRKLLSIYHNINQRFISFFPQAKVADVLLSGSLCSYLYAKNSDLDMFVVIDDTATAAHNAELARIFNSLNLFFTDIYFRPSVYQHPVDLGILRPSSPQIQYDVNQYSLLQNKWLTKPECRDFQFSAEDLAIAYRYEYYELISYMTSLEKKAQGMYSQKVASQAMHYLESIRKRAFDEKLNSPMHEYSLEYNVYRLLKRCGVYGWYQFYIPRRLNQAKEKS